MAHVCQELTLGTIGRLRLLARQVEGDLTLPPFLTGEEQPHLIFDHLPKGDQAFPVFFTKLPDLLGHNSEDPDDSARRRLQRHSGKMAKASAARPVAVVLRDVDALVETARLHGLLGQGISQRRGCDR